MKYIRVKNELLSICGLIPAGTILPVEAFNGRWRVTEGKFEGVIINGFECEAVCGESEYVRLHQELLQRREEIRELMKANKTLSEEVERLAEEQKLVKLPREVAEAIEFFREGPAPYKNIDFFTHIGTEPEHGAHNHTRSIIRYKKSHGDNLIQALVNGYEVEEPKTFQTNRTLDASEIMTIRNLYKGALMRIKDGRDKDEYCKEAIEEIALYLGGAELLKDVSEFCAYQIEREKVQTGG